MSKLEMLKGAVEIVVQFGTSSIVGNAIKTGTPPDAKTWKRIAIGVGGYVLSQMVGSQAGKYATDSIQEFVDRTKDIVRIVKPATETLKDGASLLKEDLQEAASNVSETVKETASELKEEVLTDSAEVLDTTDGDSITGRKAS